MSFPGTSKEVHLISYPQGEASPSDFAVVEVPVPDPATGQVLVHNRFISVDPYMRGRMRDAESYAPPFALGEVMTGLSVGEVVASESSGFAVGDIVLHDLGWREYALGDATAFHRITDSGAPLSAWLGVLGMVGLTAWWACWRVPRYGRATSASSRAPPAPWAAWPARSPGFMARRAWWAAPAPRRR